jgi:hypothetical protein
MTEHCGECGSEVCGHGLCPQCQPCTHCNGGDRGNKFFGYDDERTDDGFRRYGFDIDSDCG